MNLLLAAALLMQDKTAEEALKSIEDAFGRAKTLSVRYVRREPQADGGEAEARGTILLKEGNRLRWEYSSLRKGVKGDLVVVSDGARVVTVINGKRDVDRKTFKGLNETFAVLLARAGSVPILSGFRALLDNPKIDRIMAQQATPITGANLGEDEDGKKTLNYITVFNPFRSDSRTAEIRLWYEPSSYRIFKRSLTNKGMNGTIDENYSEFSINADIPDEKFKLPEEKK